MAPKATGKKQNEKITTVKLTKGTKSRLEKLRIHRRETYEEILQSMLDLLNVLRVNPERAQSKLRAIERQSKGTNKKSERKTES